MCIRQQNGSVVGIGLTALLFNERTNAQLEKVISKLLCHGLNICNSAKDRERQEDL
jgi:hypothetical protein